MTTLVVIKILVVGALLGGFVMFSIFRRKQRDADGKPVGLVGLIATMIGFVARVITICIVACSSFWFVTKFMA